jgi:hypothetical protein
MNSLVLFVGVSFFRSSDESGNSGRSCQEALEPSFAQNSSKLFFQGRLYPEVPCPHVDKDRIEAIRTNQPPPRRQLHQSHSSSRSIGIQLALLMG